MGDATSLERASARGERALAGLADKGSHHLARLAHAAVGVGAAYVGIEAAKGAVETTEALAKSTIVLQRNFGLSAKAASTWSAVLKNNNIDQASAMMSFTTLSKAINGGSKSAVAAFKDLGLSQKDLKSQDFGKTLDDVSAALTRMHGGSQRAADAQILLGRGAKLLAPLFRGDGLGFQQQAKWAEKYGVTLDGHALKSSKDLAVATTQLKFAQMGMQIQFSEKVVPILTKGATILATFVGGMRDGTGAGGKFAGEAKHIAGELKPVLGTLKDIGGFLAKHPFLIELMGGGLVAGKVASKFSGPLSALTGAAKTLTGAGIKPIPVYVVNGPGGKIPGIPGTTAAEGGAVSKVLRNPVVRGVAGTTVVGAVALLGIDASKKNFQGFTDAIVKNQAKIRDALASNDPEFAKLRDYIDKLAQQTGGPFTADAKKAAAMLDQLEGKTRKSSSAIRDASDANYGFGRSQAAVLQHADELANKVIGIGRAGGNAAGAMRRLQTAIQNLPQSARIDIIASVSETFRIGAHPSGQTTTTHRSDGTTFKSSPGAATGAYVSGPRGAGDIVPAMLKPGEVVLTERQQRMVGRGSVFSALRATGAKVIGPGGRAASGGIAAMSRAANQIDHRHYSYLWGGGHNGSFSGPYDCSGAVSAVLHAGGVLDSPLVSGQFAQWGAPGPGKVTLFANSDHVYMRIGNRYFGTSNSNPGGGAGWFPGAPRPGFVVRHVPEGLLGHMTKKGDGTDKGVKPGKTHHLQATKGGSSGFLPSGPGAGPYINGQADPGLPSDFTGSGASDTGGGGFSGGDTGGNPDQAQIDALNELNAKLQALNALLTAQAADRQKLLNVSQSQYAGLFAGFVDAISGGIGGRVGLGFMTPSTAGSFASY